MVRSHPSAQIKYMTRYRSRLTSIEEKKNTRKALYFVLLAVGFLTLFLFIGLPAVGKLLSYVSDLKKTNSVVDKYDTTPPAPPYFDYFPEAVNKASFEIKGKSEEGATVTINFNDQNQEVLAESSGDFIYNVTLAKGTNTFFATAKDASGNESIKSKIVIVVFDNEPPKLDISTPGDGASYYGSKQKDINITGTTEPGVTLTVNDRWIGVNADDGTFLYTYTLDEGENSLNFKSTDKAGNQTEKTYRVTYTN